MTRRPTRRRYLAAIGAASGVGIAGCSGGGTDDDDDAGETTATEPGGGETESDDGSEETESDDGSEETEQSRDQTRVGIEVVRTVGTAIRSRSIGRVLVTVKKVPGAGDVDLAATTMQFVHDDVTADLVFGSYSADSPTGSETTFDVTDVADEDGSIGPDGVVLNDPTDRAQLVIDTATLTDSGGGFGADETATVQLTTQSGAVREELLLTPETLEDGETVSL